MMAAPKVWKRLSRDLAVAVEQDFARKVGPLLRLLWPDIIETPHRARWDAAGIDYVCWAERDALGTVLQCKGFHVRDLRKDQANQVRDSVEKFLGSGLSCETFVVLHNRDGRHEEFNRIVHESLERLRESGRTKRVELIDRQSLLKRCENRIIELLEEAIHASSRERLRRFEALFDIGRPYLPRVPFALGEVRVKRLEPLQVDVARQREPGNIAELIVQETGLSWTLLEGAFGTGKTTAALHAALSKDRVVVFVPCADLPTSKNLSLGRVLRAAVHSTDLFASYEDADQDVLEALAAATAIRLLSRGEAATGYLLILDGVDENRVFYSLQGLQRLVNQLADLECPVALTTRTEHFSALFGNYSTAFSELSWKFGASTRLRLIQLSEWGEREIGIFVDLALADTADHVRGRLGELRKLIQERRLFDFYGELSTNPLLLHFLVEDVATNGVQVRNRATLIRSWVSRKLWRDAERRNVAPGTDVIAFVDAMNSLMERVAHRMITSERKTKLLVERISSTEVEAEAKTLIGGQSDIILEILVNSFLVPVGRRTGREVPVVFAFRILQEFFLASYLVRNNISSSGYPTSVRNFFTEIKAAQEGQ